MYQNNFESPFLELCIYWKMTYKYIANGSKEFMIQYIDREFVKEYIWTSDMKTRI